MGGDRRPSQPRQSLTQVKLVFSITPGQRYANPHSRGARERTQIRESTENESRGTSRFPTEASYF